MAPWKADWGGAPGARPGRERKRITRASAPGAPTPSSGTPSGGGGDALWPLVGWNKEEWTVMSGSMDTLAPNLRAMSLEVASDVIGGGGDSGMVGRMGTTEAGMTMEPTGPVGLRKTMNTAPRGDDAPGGVYSGAPTMMSGWVSPLRSPAGAMLCPNRMAGWTGGGSVGRVKGIKVLPWGFRGENEYLRLMDLSDLGKRMNTAPVAREESDPEGEL